MRRATLRAAAALPWHVPTRHSHPAAATRGALPSGLMVPVATGCALGPAWALSGEAGR